MLSTNEENRARKHFAAQGIHSCYGISFEQLYGELYGDELMQSYGGSCAAESRVVAARDLVGRLSKEAREVVDVIVNIPGELVEVVAGKRGTWRGVLTVRDVRWFLHTQYGWSHRAISRALAEVKKALAC